MNARQATEIQILTDSMEQEYPGSSFRNSTAAGSRTVVIDCYRRRGYEYLGCFVVLSDGRFDWHPVRW